MAYEGTAVTVSKSQEQIRTVLRRHKASRVNFGEDYTVGEPTLGVEFVHTDTLVRLLGRVVIAKQPPRGRKTVDELVDEESRRMWRVIHWAIKSRMEAVEEGLETFEQAFLPHIVDPASGRTLWDAMHGAVESGALKLGGRGIPALTSGGAGA